MKTTEKDFSHVSNFTGYMAKVATFVKGNGEPGQSVLDIPAGNGLLADSLRQRGFDVTCADINAERKDFVFANMEEPLPFQDSVFDFVICMEGVEHVLNPAGLIRELCRVTRGGGHVILTTPNVQSLYSRLNFLFFGFLYQFDPEGRRHPEGQTIDRGHVSPMTYMQLDYLFEEFGLTRVHVDGDRLKKKILLPFYFPLLAFARFYAARRSRKAVDESMRDLFARSADLKLLLSRSIVAAWKK